MESAKRVLGKLDDAVFRVERLVLLFSLAMMTLLVSLDVVQRTFSRPEGKTEQALLALLYGGRPTLEQTAFVTGRLGPAVFWGLALIFLVLAAHSSRSIAAERAQKPAPGLGRSVAVGAGLWGAMLGFVYGLLWLFPSSVPGAQKFSLGFMLWSGMLGASLATRSRRHIVLDVLKKKLDPETAKPFALLGGLVTFAFCGLLAALGTMQFWTQFTEWREGEGVGVYDALPIPMWLATLAIPVTFGVMALRFLAQGVHDWRWGPPKGGVDAHGIDLEALEQGPAAPGADGGTA
ncbi:MAG: TRAP transporter small permease subunit [Myxococcales bacterium]|nr:TRAP transporter small permease subunit [Myxococcales bacterium]